MTTTRILVDTDIIIDFLRGHPAAVAFMKANESRIVLSAISVAELYAGVRGSKELNELQEFIGLFAVLPVTEETARIAGEFRRQFGRSHCLALGDALVAATVTLHAVQMGTLNIRHFPMMKNLKPPYRKK